MYSSGAALPLTALLILCSSPGPGAAIRAQTTASGFCRDVQKVVGMRSAGFSPVRGAVDGPPSDDGFQFYDAQFKLTGAANCKVWSDVQDRGWGYDCSWPIVDSGSGQQQFAMLTDGVTSCYPHARTDRPWAGRFAIESPHIKIRFRDAGARPGIVLTIE
jgi:hypothetical protein